MKGIREPRVLENLSEVPADQAELFIRAPKARGAMTGAVSILGEAVFHRKNSEREEEEKEGGAEESCAEGGGSIRKRRRRRRN